MAGVAQQTAVKVAGGDSLQTEIDLLHQVPEQAEMTTEMVVVGMDIQVDCLGHMVGEDGDEVHMAATEAMVQTMRGRIRGMVLPNGIQDPRMGRMVGTVFQVLKSKTHLAKNLSLAVGEQVEVEVEVELVVAIGVVVVVAAAATVLDGAKEAVVEGEGEGEVGMVRVQMMLGLRPEILDGVVDLREAWQAQAGNGWSGLWRQLVKQHISALALLPISLHSQMLEVTILKEFWFCL